MSTNYKIILYNKSLKSHNFYIFQHPSDFGNNYAEGSISSSSLGCQCLATYEKSGAQAEFELDAQILAGAISTMDAPNTVITTVILPSNSSQHHDASTISETAAQRQIDVSKGPNDTTSNDSTKLTIQPVGLTQPENKPSLDQGCFSFQIPSFIPNEPPQLVCGNAVMNNDNTVILSSYVAPNPNSQLICRPVEIYYLKIGNEPTGSKVDFKISNAAICDFSNGNSTITVTYQRDGTFTI